MFSFNKIFAIAAFVPLAACAVVETSPAGVATGPISNGLLERAQSDIRDMMKDPESAKFRDAKTYRSQYGDEIICGEYDAKNEFGGYSGYTTYYYRFRNGNVMKREVDVNSGPYHALLACTNAAAGQIDIPSDQAI